MWPNRGGSTRATGRNPRESVVKVFKGMMGMMLNVAKRAKKVSR